MSSDYPFNYLECLSEPALQRLTENLHIKGNNRDSYLLLIIRLLSGAVKFQHVKSGKLIRQSDNYFSGDLKGYGQRWDKLFPKLIAEEYTLESLDRFINSNRVQNKDFYKNILAELTYYFYYQKKSGHATAFIFLYRALEHISYAFPLIYASRAEDFSKSYSDLKALMSDNKGTGELGFFKKFVETIFKGDPISESSIDFPILLDTESEQEEMFNILEGLCNNKKNKNMIADATQRPRIFSVRYIEVGSFIILIRNRFFHYMNNHSENIKASQVSDVDVFFKVVNEKCFYWLSTIFLAVFSHVAIGFETVRNRSS